MLGGFRGWVLEGLRVSNLGTSEGFERFVGFRVLGTPKTWKYLPVWNWALNSTCSNGISPKFLASLKARVSAVLNLEHRADLRGRFHGFHLKWTYIIRLFTFPVFAYPFIYHNFTRTSLHDHFSFTNFCFYMHSGSLLSCHTLIDLHPSARIVGHTMIVLEDRIQNVQICE